jgi:hypothetical protein
VYDSRGTESVEAFIISTGERGQALSQVAGIFQRHNLLVAMEKRIELGRTNAWVVGNI